MRRLLARLALLVVVTVALLLVAEGVARAVLPAPAPYLQPRQIHRARGNKGPIGQWSLESVMRKSDDPYLREVHAEFHPDVRFRVCYDGSTGDRRPYMDDDGCVLVEINEHRLRGPAVPKDKPADAYRIAAIGDSFTFGDGVPWDATWPEGVRRRLDARLAERPAVSLDGETRWRRCETVNLGVPGYEVRDCEVYMRHRALEWEPDTIVYALFINDVLPEADKSEQEAELAAAYREANDPPTWLERYSRLWRAWTSRRAQRRLDDVLVRQYADAVREGSDAWKHVRQCIGRMKYGADSRDVDLRVVVFPALVGLADGYPYAPVHQRLRELFDLYEIPWLDLLDVYRGREARSLWVHSTDHHPNEVALDLAAEAIAAWIADDVLAR